MNNVECILFDSIYIPTDDFSPIYGMELRQKLYSDVIRVTHESLDGAIWDSCYAYLYE